MSHPTPSTPPQEPIDRYPVPIPPPRQASPVQLPSPPLFAPSPNEAAIFQERSPSKRELLPHCDPHQRLYGPSNPWATDICYCHDDLTGCLIACFCPCITFGQIAEIIDDGYPSCTVSALLYCLVMSVSGCPCLYSCFYRKKIRHRYNLEEEPCGDWLVHLCCESSALRQEYRELQSRGFDPSIGWLGNITRRRREDAEMTPPPRQTMFDEDSTAPMR